MKTFVAKRKQSASTIGKARPYFHHPIGAMQKAQKAAMRKILLFDEVKTEPDINKSDRKYEQESNHATVLSVSAISGIPPSASPELIQRNPSTPTDLREKRVLFNSALTKLQRLDNRIHSLFVAAGLSRPKKQVLSEKGKSTGRKTEIVNFNLIVKSGSLSTAVANFRKPNFIVTQDTKKKRVKEADMVVTIDFSNASSAEKLASTLYHEGLHMIMFIDACRPVKNRSAHFIGLERFRKIAGSHREYLHAVSAITHLMTNEYIRLLEAHGRKITSAMRAEIAMVSWKAAVTFLEAAVEEKYIETIIAGKTGRVGISNETIALAYVLLKIAQVLQISLAALLSSNQESTKDIQVKIVSILRALEGNTYSKSNVLATVPYECK